ncbi:MAG TPA: signal peptidase I [Candidatus Syntrophoarchaeum butanivorans]|uniref:Signal peptidase I n=1 Tax=Candidatus Syntropharchaeum butanivorans TaxID=1839936 RepID=A0A7C0X2T2_9EURY|nr:MAG: signal peptidase I [Candidatus Syntrophoarchaeum sp. WYZ-LMO15]HDM36233.1 signal peptidase I [Candidatus Syntrophoarchaeum butanivorans]
MSARDIIIDLGKDLLFALFVVSIVASVAYAFAGTWPVAVAVESGSMEPNIHQGDLVLIKSPDRMGIIPYEDAIRENYTRFNGYGDVIVYMPDGNPHTTPIIHRAIKWVEKGELMPNGYRAPYSGYITKGDHNAGYDQPGLSGPVKPEWIIGVAYYRIGVIGKVRLLFSWS